MNDVSKQYDDLMQIFETFRFYFECMQIRKGVPLTEQSTHVIESILTLFLNVLAHATKMVKDGRMSVSPIICSMNL